MARQPIYYMWVYSPTTGHVTLAHDEESSRANQEYHLELRERRHEEDLVHGYAYRIKGGWRITDWEHKPFLDRHGRRVIVESIHKREGHGGKLTTVGGIQGP